MKAFRSLFLMALTCVLILCSCKKDEVTYGPSPVQSTGDPTIASVPLNGGGVTGRWILTIQQFATYRNDTLESVNTMNNPPNMVLVLSANGTMEIIDGMDTIPCSYSTSGNQFTYSVNQAVSVFSYGVANNLLRWNMVDSYTNNGNFYREEIDYLFERY